MQRRQLLEKIYAPFKGLLEHSQEYNALAASGQVWETWFQPFSKMDVDLRYQEGHRKILDALRSFTVVKEDLFAARLVRLVAPNFLQFDDASGVRPDFSSLLRSGRAPGFSDEEVQITANTQEAINRMLENQAYIGLEEEKEYHKILLQKTTQENVAWWSPSIVQSAGQYRKHPLRPAFYEEQDHDCIFAASSLP
ncbi:hypothetical protein SELMODRAFT_418277 [Selaginella moellendorffii]|uniref:Uncharacterized protein n=1 Tax=Selaginella moellendorffii TaxID=88036 RepID=D8S577_SELML|nr:hypothetical protein SELMODRAFT_418277 [Selaginella moellendorffii]